MHLSPLASKNVICSVASPAFPDTSAVVPPAARHVGAGLEDVANAALVAPDTAAAAAPAVGRIFKGGGDGGGRGTPEGESQTALSRLPETLRALHLMAIEVH